MLKPIIGIVAITLATPALADEYWVQYDYSTHDCSVVQSATHQTATRFPWSPPNDGRKPNGPLNGRPNGASAAAKGGEIGSSNDAEGTNGAGTREASNSTADTANEASTAENSNTSSNAANKAGAPNDSNSSSSAGTTNNTDNDFAKELEASWKRKAKLAEENKIDVSKALVGSAMHTQEEAEEEMQIMRICGLKN